MSSINKKKVLIKVDKKLIYIPIEKLLKKYDPLIQRICIKWAKKFSMDKSISQEDLVQELQIKLLQALTSFALEKGKISSFITFVARNHFINMLKRSKETNNSAISYYTKVMLSESEESFLLELIPDNGSSPIHNLMYEELIEEVRRKLNNVNYTPRKQYNFYKDGDSFAKTVFDVLLKKDRNFIRYMLFNHRCRIRFSKANQAQIPKKVLLTTKMMATYFNVNINSINIAYRSIKDAIINMKKEVENGSET